MAPISRGAINSGSRDARRNSATVNEEISSSLISSVPWKKKTRGTRKASSRPPEVFLGILVSFSSKSRLREHAPKDARSWFELIARGVVLAGKFRREASACREHPIDRNPSLRRTMGTRIEFPAGSWRAPGLDIGVAIPCGLRGDIPDSIGHELGGR